MSDGTFLSGVTAVSKTCTPEDKRGKSGAYLGEAHIASAKTATQKNAAQVESIGADVAFLANGLAENGWSAVTVVRTKKETECSRSEFESVEVGDTLGRAISIVQRRMVEDLAYSICGCRSLLECRGGAGIGSVFFEGHAEFECCAQWKLQLLNFLRSLFQQLLFLVLLFSS